MDILIISDSHGFISDTETVIEKHNIKRAIFLGDGSGDVGLLSKIYPSVTFNAVRGNCDTFSDFPEQTVLDIEGHKIFCCHGHRYGVKSGLLRLKYAAESEKCDIALFGHTHIQFSAEEDGILLLNPGSIGFSGKYALLSLEKGKKPKASLY